MSGASRGGLSLQSSVVDDGSSTTAEMLYLISLYLEKHTPCTALSKRLVEELVCHFSTVNHFTHINSLFLFRNLRHASGPYLLGMAQLVPPRLAIFE